MKFASLFLFPLVLLTSQKAHAFVPDGEGGGGRPCLMGFVPDGEGGGSPNCPPQPLPERHWDGHGPQRFICGEGRDKPDAALASLQEALAESPIRVPGPYPMRFVVMSYSTPSFTPYQNGRLQACVTATGYYIGGN